MRFWVVCTFCTFFKCVKIDILYYFTDIYCDFLGLFEMRSDQLRSHWFQLF